MIYRRNYMDSTKIDFLYLSEEDMIKAGVMDMPACVETMEEVIKLINDGDYMMSGKNHNSHGAMVSFPDNPEFPGMPKNGRDRRFMAMPAYLGGKFNMAGVKWYGSNTENKDRGLPRSILMLTLSNKDTGAPVAFMSANLISSYRTGAIPGVGAKYLAKKNSKVLGLVGPGVMGRTVVQGICSVCKNIDTLKIKGRSGRSTGAFIDFVKKYIPQITSIETVDSIEAVVRDSDVVTLCTSSPVSLKDYPFIEESWIKKGALFCLPATVNFSNDFIIHDCKKVVDNIKLYDAWAEEYPYPTFGDITIIGSKFTDLVHEGKIRREDIVDLGDIIKGKAAGRDSEDQIILYSVGGMPIEDIAWGKTIYENALKNGIGTKLHLWDTPMLS